METKMRLFAATVVLACSAFIGSYCPINVKAASVQDYETVNVEIDRVKQSFEQPALLINGSTMVPLRAVLEKLGSTVGWNQATQTVTSTRKETVIKLRIGDEYAYVNNSQVKLTAPALIVNETTMIPLRFFSEALGATVGWNSSTKTALIRTIPVSDIDIQYKDLGSTPINRTSRFYEGYATVQLAEKSWVFIDQYGNESEVMNYDYVGSVQDGMALVMTDINTYTTASNGWRILESSYSLRGFVDVSGKEVVKPQYDYAHAFHNGLAKVMKDGKSGMINKEGLEVLPIEYLFDVEYDGSLRLYEGLSSIMRDGKFGFINGDARMVLEPQFEEAKRFSEGVAAVKKNGEWYLIDHEGNRVMSLPFDNARYFTEGLLSVCKNELWGVIDRRGNMIVEPQYAGIYDFKNGFSIAAKGLGQVGYIDSTGKVVIPMKYASFEDSKTEEGLTIVLAGVGIGLTSTSRPDNNFSILPYEGISPDYHNGLLAVMKENKWGFIDTAGREVVVPQYDQTRKLNIAFTVSKGGKWGLIDRSGAEIVPLEYDQISDYKNGLAVVEKNKKFGYIDLTGKVIIPIEFDSASVFEGPYAAVIKKGKWGILSNPLDFYP
jgi:hypothetical protein